MYHLPSYLSQETKSLLSQMLVVDPVKRITIPEIRELSWFKVGLPKYLEPLPPTTPSNDNEEPPSVEEPDNGDEVSPDLGLIDRNIVNELVEKMGPFDIEQIIAELKAENENQFKVAYQLVRDQKRMVETAGDRQDQAMDNFLSSSPPAWNAGLEHMTGSRRSTSIKRKSKNAAQEKQAQPADEDYDEYDEFDELDDFDLEERFAVLDSSLPQNNDEEGSAAYKIESLKLNDSHKSQKKDPTKVLQSRSSQPMTVEPMSTIPAASIVPEQLSTNKDTSKHVQRPDTASTAPTKEKSAPSSSSAAKKSKASKWHFGIRSRSPPMEVMLEIYRTLKSLGMEWKKKDLPAEPPRSDNHDDLQIPQDLFFVETRSRIKNVIIRMDLQLYRVDESNYLVDFRLVDYFPIPPNSEDYIKYDNNESSAENSPGLKSLGETSNSASEGHSTPNVDRLYDANQKPAQSQQEGDVWSPFLFLDCACKLIVELAGASG